MQQDSRSGYNNVKKAVWGFFCANDDPDYTARLINYKEETDFNWWVTKMDNSKIPKKLNYALSLLEEMNIDIFQKCGN